jgi:hypothetical protein
LFDGLLQVSTIFLTLVEFEYFSETISVMNQLCFALSFMLFRVIVVPYIWIGQVKGLLQEESLETNWCLPWYFNPFVIVMGVVFHSLNFFCKWVSVTVRKRASSACESSKLIVRRFFAYQNIVPQCFVHRVLQDCAKDNQKSEGKRKGERKE